MGIKMSGRFFAELASRREQENFILEDIQLAKLLDSTKKRVHILAMGDVGGTLLTGLHLLGNDVIDCIGICDVKEEGCKRWEAEVNQISYPFDFDLMPPIDIISMDQLFECDVFVFCASKSVPAVGEKVSDVRMIQLEENEKLVRYYAELSLAKGFAGLFAIVSDPVDPLCQVAAATGIKETAIKGFGLGVMNARAAYYAKKDLRFKQFLSEGRAFGPHGKDLVIANSVITYDDDLSKELTTLAVEANLRVREAGFKPFIAPAYSSGAISILQVLRGAWHYSSCPLGRVFFGTKNRLTKQGIEVENLYLPEALFMRLQTAYHGLEELLPKI